MRSLGFLLATVLLSQYSIAFSGGHRDIYQDHYGRDLHPRGIVYNGKIADEYDFVIVGGGTAGLVLASRLSEDLNTTVLVLEAGDSGDAVADTINTPVMAYYAGLPGSPYDWAYTTVNQPNAGNRTMSWPSGKVLGGSSAMNGMQDSETFTPPSSDVQTIAKIDYEASSRGTDGPIQATYPAFEFTTLGKWTTTSATLGIEVQKDAYSGNGWGAFVASSSINPANWTRSYACSGYIDPLPPRDNLAILPNATVTRLLFDASKRDNLTATGIEWASTADAPRQTVTVRREVILAAGTMGSPRVLQHSGVGPADVLSAAGVEVQLDLPGVGQHLQDHISSGLLFTTDTDTARSLYDSNATGNTPEFLSYVNSAIAYVDADTLFGAEDASTLKQQALDELSSSMNALPSASDEVKKGFVAIYKATLDDILPSKVGQVEILLQLTSSAEGTNVITIQAGLQHPFSHGRLYITSSDPFAKPAIDPQYLTHVTDRVILREGFKLARKVGRTAPLNAAIKEEIQPGPEVQTDEQWDEWIAQSAGTEYHPSSSCAMLPREQGGVVDANMKVYGLGNVRVVDASVFPISVSAHLQAPVYGLAEGAAKILRAQYNGVGEPDLGSKGSNDSGENGALILRVVSSGFFAILVALSLASLLS